MKHNQFLRTLKQVRFSGQLMQTDVATKQQWIFYLAEGRLIHATGGIHAVRRWQRNLAVYCPGIPNHRTIWQQDLVNTDPADCLIGWDYALLNLWVAQQKITREQAQKFLQAAIVEILFDIAQGGEIKEQIRHNTAVAKPAIALEVDEVITEAQQLWQTWQAAKLGSYSPNGAPVIQQPEQLRKYSSSQVYQALVNVLQGQHSLRDLAVTMQRNVVEVATSLLPWLQVGCIELTEIADLPVPSYTPIPSVAKSTPVKAAVPLQSALIACVDDSPLILRMMEKLVTSAGYQFLGINDALRTIGILLSRKPDLIFLDLVMPKSNGYEICEQLRKISCFRQTPIVILTGKQGVGNRQISDFVGASDFLNKPLDTETVLTVIRKHLKNSSANSSTHLSAARNR